VADPLGALLFLFGVGFLAANLILIADYLRYLRRRKTAWLVWPTPRPRMLVLPIGIAAGLAALIGYKLIILGWRLTQVFGEAMMFVYYAYLYPLGFQVRRGFYADGIWLDRGFVRYGDVTAITWHEDPRPALIVVSGLKQRAGRLTVPPEHYGAVRRLLRDRIKAQDLHLGVPLLDLGGHDERDDV
jgi:hypothetical protein